jgi:hypothetical protein
MWRHWYSHSLWWFDWTLTVAHGQHGNFQIFRPLVGFAASFSHAMSRPTFLLEEALYTEGPLFLLFTRLLFLCCCHCFFFLALAFSAQPPSASPLHARKEGCTQSEDGQERDPRSTGSLHLLMTQIWRRPRRRGSSQRRRLSSSPATSVCQNHRKDTGWRGVNSTNVLDEGLRIGEIGRRMNSKVNSVKQGGYESKCGCKT